MKQKVELTNLELEKVKRLAEKKRRILGFVGDTPTGENILKILDELGIILLEYPLESAGNQPAFSGALLYSEIANKELVFLGLNTADYLDNQIFTIAHELYHFFAKTGSHFSRPAKDADLTETKADHFASEFLLPQQALRNIVLEEFNLSSLDSIRFKTLLRFATRLHCAWQLPYRKIIRSLRMAGVIDSAQHQMLADIDERGKTGEYWRYGRAVFDDLFLRLNQKTWRTGTSPKMIDLIVRNFEDGVIDADHFQATLSLFEKTPEEMGYSLKVSPEDVAEFDDLWSQEDNDADQDEQ